MATGLKRIKTAQEIFEEVPHIKKIGAKHLCFDFDKEADVLYITLEPSQRATDKNILEDSVFLPLRDLVLNFVFFMVENFKTFLVPACPGKG